MNTLSISSAVFGLKKLPYIDLPFINLASDLTSDLDSSSLSLIDPITIEAFRISSFLSMSLESKIFGFVLDISF